MMCLSHDTEAELMCCCFHDDCPHAGSTNDMLHVKELTITCELILATSKFTVSDYLTTIHMETQGRGAGETLNSCLWMVFIHAMSRGKGVDVGSPLDEIIEQHGYVWPNKLCFGFAILWNCLIGYDLSP
ncbi:hypothetical protein Ancab_000185 [Ancistrocladus abbreviatus]